MQKTSKSKIVLVNDKMQINYQYELTEPVGKNFDLNFKPELSPKELLELGIFGGRYMRDCKNEFPKSWFIKAKFHKENTKGHDKNLNYFGVEASQSLKEWSGKGWIYKEDPRGWFQWYCRYYMGRRIQKEDMRQIKRWNGIKRHIFQLANNCRHGDMHCRPRQRQALLHWAYDSRKI